MARGSKRAAYFNVGDIVLYGRWKNHKGRILSFGSDAKGNPIVTIEPIPKGRKQNKIMGLFKFWKAPLEKQGMDYLGVKVAFRHCLAAGIPLGKTVEQGNIRVHRYRDQFFVWDLTNAGKRGKKVRQLAVSPSYQYKGGTEEWMRRMSIALEDYEDYDRVKAFFKDILEDYPGEINLNESLLRGIDVDPPGTEKVEIKTSTGISITALPTEFRLMSSTPLTRSDGTPSGDTQDTLYYPVSKSDARVFYAWILENRFKANKMTIEDFRKLWRDLGVKYDYQ